MSVEPTHDSNNIKVLKELGALRKQPEMYVYW